MSSCENNLLASLRAADRAILTERCQMVELPTGHSLYQPGDNVLAAYFPLGAAIASFLVEMPDGHSIETAMVGREGAVGGIVSHGHMPAYTHSKVLHGGKFLKIDSARLEDAKEESDRLRNLFARYADCLLAQIFQSVACNAAHRLEQRAAKWLVASVERTGQNHIHMTQEQFASILGVGRGYASRHIQKLKADQLLLTRRNALIVIDPEGMRARACACNILVKAHFDRVLAGIYPTLDDSNGKSPQD